MTAAAGTGPRERRSYVGRRRIDWGGNAAVAVYRVVLLLTILLAWQFVAASLVDPKWISRPTDIARALQGIWESGTLVSDVAATTLELVIGLLIGTLLGITVALALGLNKTAADIFAPFITLAYSFPQLAIAPLYVLWFGIYTTPKIVLVTVVVFFIMFLNVFQGLNQVDDDLMNTLRVMGARRRQVLRMVVLPSVLLFVSTGLKNAVPFGLRAAIFAEILISTKGLGHVLSGASELFDSAAMFAALALIMTIGVVLNVLVELQDKYFSRWRPPPTM